MRSTYPPDLKARVTCVIASMFAEYRSPSVSFRMPVWTTRTGTGWRPDGILDWHPPIRQELSIHAISIPLLIGNLFSTVYSSPKDLSKSAFAAQKDNNACRF